MMSSSHSNGIMGAGGYGEMLASGGSGANSGGPGGHVGSSHMVSEKKIKVLKKNPAKKTTQKCKKPLKTTPSALSVIVY